MGAIKNGTSDIYLLLSRSKDAEVITKKFRLCDPISTDPNDISNLFETLAGNFAGIVQYNKDNRVGPKGVNNVTIDSLCELMTGKGYEPLDALAAVNNLLLTTYDQRCLDYKYDTMIQELRNSNWSSPTAEGGSVIEF